MSNPTDEAHREHDDQLSAATYLAKVPGQLVRMVRPGPAMADLQAATDRLGEAIARLDARMAEVEATLASDPDSAA
jgi:ubiquinone biosynthesis protein UbiJ